MTGVHFMIGIMPILRSSFSFKDLPTVINGAHLQRIYWSILMITADQLQKNSLWYLYTDNTTANTNTGFEARRLLT